MRAAAADLSRGGADRLEGSDFDREESNRYDASLNAGPVQSVQFLFARPDVAERDTIGIVTSPITIDRKAGTDAMHQIVTQGRERFREGLPLSEVSSSRGPNQPSSRWEAMAASIHRRASAMICSSRST